MSLEQKIEELTAAIKALITALPSTQNVIVEKAAVEKVAVEKVAVEKVAVKVEEVKKSTPDATTPPQSKVPGTTYDDVKRLILSISAKSRDAAVDVLAIFGATSGPKLREEQYAKFVAAAENVLEQLIAKEE